MRKFAKGVAQGKSYSDSYRKAGYNARLPGQEAQKLLKKPEVQTAIVKEEERLQRVLNAEIDNKRITAKYSDLMEAEKDGQPDNTSQLKALHQIHLIRGDYAPEKSIRVNAEGKDFLEKLSEKAQEN